MLFKSETFLLNFEYGRGGDSTELAAGAAGSGLRLAARVAESGSPSNSADMTIQNEVWTVECKGIMIPEGHCNEPKEDSLYDCIYTLQKNPNVWSRQCPTDAAENYSNSPIDVFALWVDAVDGGGKTIQMQSPMLVRRIDLAYANVNKLTYDKYGNPMPEINRKAPEITIVNSGILPLQDLLPSFKPETAAPPPPPPPRATQKTSGILGFPQLS